MQTWDAIRARRNVRSYRPDPISDSDLAQIAEAGWRAPSRPTASTGTSSSSPTAPSWPSCPPSGGAPAHR